MPIFDFFGGSGYDFGDECGGLIWFLFFLFFSPFVAGSVCLGVLLWVFLVFFFFFFFARLLGGGFFWGFFGFLGFFHSFSFLFQQEEQIAECRFGKKKRGGKRR